MPSEKDVMREWVGEMAAFLTGKIAEDYAKSYTKVTPPQIVVEEGRRYFKLITVGQGSRSVYCFIERANGDILKAEGWAKPAKHARGSIYDENYSWGKGLGTYGAAYMR